MTYLPGQSATDPAVGCTPPAIGARLRLLRTAAGLTQAALGERLGTTQSAIARLEAGQQRLSVAALNRAALALGCDVHLVFEKSEAS